MSERISFLGLIDNDIPAWAVRQSYSTHYLGSNWKINRLLSQRPLAAMALCDWQLQPKVVPGDHEGLVEQAAKGVEGGDPCSLTLWESLTIWDWLLHNTPGWFSLTEWSFIQLFEPTLGSRHHPANQSYQCLLSGDFIIAQCKAGH